ncbi:S-adenosyl-L-methionine-dependent methyltransferase [Pilobolus umbonatus]|nr:S-adenosyl-L-methionine-dependent methyltransferase [Pilobolus umbonatus]
MVLDVGCGSGSWLMDMATEFPSAQFIGIDQASLFPTDIRPPNVEFKKVNILNGLPYEDNTFDVVQMRLFLFAFNKYQWVQSMKEIYRVLKPGGFIQLLEVQMIDPGDEIVQSFGNKVKEIMESNDCDPEICSKLPSLIESSGFVPMEDVRESVNLATNDSLANEFMYIIDISVNSSRSLIMAIYNLQSEEEYQNLKAIYLESRRTTSESTWYCAVGQKPHPHS